MSESDTFTEITPKNGPWTSLRKHQVDLATAGDALIAFGVWSLLKTYLGILFSNALETWFQVDINTITDEDLMVTIVALLLMTVVIFIVHFIIYRGARKEGHGKKAGFFYLILAFLYMVLSVISAGSTILYPSTAVGNPFMSILFDLTIALINADVLYNGIQCRKLNRQLSETEGGATNEQ